MLIIVKASNPRMILIISFTNANIIQNNNSTFLYLVANKNFYAFLSIFLNFVNTLCLLSPKRKYQALPQLSKHVLATALQIIFETLSRSVDNKMPTIVQARDHVPQASISLLDCTQVNFLNIMQEEENGFEEEDMAQQEYI